MATQPLDQTPQEHTGVPAAKPQTEVKHPRAHRADLEPNRLLGQNIGTNPLEQPGVTRASELKDVVSLLDDFDQDELTQILVVTEHTRLQQGATYLDLKDPARVPFTAMGGEVVGPDRYLVPKAHVPYQYWNRLLGHESPQRTV
jgi:hypothetical protein